MRKLFYVISLLVVATQASFAVPLTMTYQGKLTTSAGLPVADGSHTLSFGFYSNATGGSPLWSHGPVNVTTTGGVFSASLPLNSSQIMTDSTIWLQTTADGSVLLPRVQLFSAPYAVRASNADSANSVPDGSITPQKLSPQITFPRPSFKTGIMSGLPEGSYLQFYIDTTAVAPVAWLGAPFDVFVAVVEHRIIGPNGTSITRKIPGEKDWSTLVIQRPVTSDKSWLDWAIKSGSSTIKKDVDFKLFDPTNKVICEWNGGLAWIHKYNLKLVDDGFPIEEISLVYQDESSLPVAKVVKFTDFLPTGVPVQTGMTTAFFNPDVYKLRPEGLATLNNNPIVSDISFQYAIVNQTGTTQKRKLPGTADLADIEVIGAPGSSKYLLESWEMALDGQPDRTILDLLIGKDSKPFLKLNETWPSRYRLFPADDGLPVEQFTIVHEGVSQ